LHFLYEIFFFHKENISIRSHKKIMAQYQILPKHMERDVANFQNIDAILSKTQKMKVVNFLWSG